MSSFGCVGEQLAALSAKPQFKTFGIDSSEFGDGKGQSLRREGRGQGVGLQPPKVCWHLFHFTDVETEAGNRMELNLICLMPGAPVTLRPSPNPPLPTPYSISLLSLPLRGPWFPPQVLHLQISGSLQINLVTPCTSPAHTSALALEISPTLSLPSRLVLPPPPPTPAHSRPLHS